MTKQELRSDLQDIRYYYIHKAMFDKAETTGFKSETLKKIERYGRLMTKAPPRLYVLYYLLSTIYYMWKGRHSTRQHWNRT